MDEITVANTVHRFLMQRMVSISIYMGNVNQFINIIKGDDFDNIKEQYYPNKDIQFFKEVLDQLGESYE